MLKIKPVNLKINKLQFLVFILINIIIARQPNVSTSSLVKRNQQASLYFGAVPARENQSEQEFLPLELIVTESENIPRLNEPVTSGIPIPLEMDLTDVSKLRLLNEEGHVIAAQFIPLARWGGSPDDSDTPIRWLLLDFQTNLTEGATAIYQVGFIEREPVYPFLNMREEDDAFIIETGQAFFTVDKADGSLMLPGLIEPIYGEILDENGEKYATSEDASVSISMQGPMRISLKVKGAYRDDEGHPLLDYTTYYWFYAGQPYVRLFHSVENNNPCSIGEWGQIECFDYGSEGSVGFRDLSFVIETDLTGFLRFSVGGKDELVGELDDNLLLYQDSSGTEYWNLYEDFTDWEGEPLETYPRMQSQVSFRGYRLYSGGMIVDEGEHSQGWVKVSDPELEWGVAVRDFWRTFPKALRVSFDGRIEIGLFPDEFGLSTYSFNLRAGEHKTHEILLNPMAEKSSLTTTLNNPLFAKTCAEWYVNSGSFGLTATRDFEDWPEYEDYIDHQLSTAPNYEDWMDWYKNLFAAIEETDFYGVFDYGDVPIDYEGYGVAPLNLKYHMDYGMWLQWLRGGDQKWFLLAEAADRHVADIDILHGLHTPRHWSDGIMFGHSEHDESGFTNPHRNANSGHPDTAFGVPGLYITYYLTGYEKARDAAVELSDCIEWRLRNDVHFMELFEDSNGEGYALADWIDGMYSDTCRPAANNLFIMVEAYRATGEKRYLAATNALVDWALADRQPYIDGPTDERGSEQYMSPQWLNLYCVALGNYLRMCDEFGLSDNNNASSSLLRYQDFLLTHAWIDLPEIESGSRGAYPYHWFFDGRKGVSGEANDNGDPSICNFLLVGADALAYAYENSGEPRYLEHAKRLFRTGINDPWYEGDDNTYSSTKETANSLVFGHVFIAVQKMNPDVAHEFSLDVTPAPASETESSLDTSGGFTIPGFPSSSIVLGLTLMILYLSFKRVRGDLRA